MYINICANESKVRNIYLGPYKTPQHFIWKYYIIINYYYIVIRKEGCL